MNYIYLAVLCMLGMSMCAVDSIYNKIFTFNADCVHLQMQCDQYARLVEREGELSQRLHGVCSGTGVCLRLQLAMYNTKHALRMYGYPSSMENIEQYEYRVLYNILDRERADALTRCYYAIKQFTGPQSPVHDSYQSAMLFSPINSHYDPSVSDAFIRDLLKDTDD